MSAKKYIVSGRVQGVGFRWFVKARAQALGIKGKVRNTSNGMVEVYAEAPGNILSVFEEVLKQGPPASRVDSVKTENLTGPSGGYSNFEIVF